MRVIYSEKTFTCLADAQILYPTATMKDLVFSYNGNAEDGELEVPYYIVALPAIQGVVKITESIITDDNAGWGSGGYRVGELVAILIPSTLKVGDTHEFEMSHESAEIWGRVESSNKGVIVYVDEN